MGKRNNRRRRRGRKGGGRGLPRPTVVTNAMYYGVIPAGTKIKIVYVTEGDSSNDAYRVIYIKAQVSSQIPSHCQLTIVGDGDDDDVSATSSLLQTGNSTRTVSVHQPRGEGYRTDQASPLTCGYLINCGANEISYVVAVKIVKQVMFDTSSFKIEEVSMK